MLQRNSAIYPADLYMLGFDRGFICNLTLRLGDRKALLVQLFRE